MNHPDRLSHVIPDVQAMADQRRLAIDWVGLKSIRHPLLIADRANTPESTVALCDLYVNVPAPQRGAHMSRLVEVLQTHRLGNSEALTVANVGGFVRDMVTRLQADAGFVKLSFPLFLRKFAPASAVPSLLDYEVSLSCELHQDTLVVTEKVTVPVTSLCPSSKEISQYGAHNQRSHISVEIQCVQPLWLTDLIELIEANASAELYALLKRIDEKHVTEQAYDNPKFVEDMVRDIAAALNNNEGVLSYVVEAENFESIHNHSAYAQLRRAKKFSP